MNPGFYKINLNGGLMFAPNFVCTSNFQLSKDDPDINDMEVTDGWKWFNSDSDAYTFFNITPENQPWEVSCMQAKIALNNAGLLDQVETYISTASKNTQLAWELASTFNRNSVLLKELASQLNLTETDIDNLFIAAKEIKV